VAPLELAPLKQELADGEPEPMSNAAVLEQALRQAPAAHASARGWWESRGETATGAGRQPAAGPIAGDAKTLAARLLAFICREQPTAQRCPGLSQRLIERACSTKKGFRASG